MENKRLRFGPALGQAITIGLKNIPSLIGASVLWTLTCWIPYINVGTTIAIASIPIELSKGKMMNPLSIFSSKYRRYMGEFFLTKMLSGFGTFFGLLFLIIPGFVISISWSQAFYILIEKGKNPAEAIKASNDATYGSKWIIFLLNLTLQAAALFLLWFIISICLMINGTFGAILLVLFCAAWLLCYLAVTISLRASIWRQLKENVQ